jgi:hypothetical protein
MPKVMTIVVAIEFPSDEWEEAAQKVALKPLVEKFTADLNTAGVSFEINTTTSDVKGKGPGAKRGRKPKLPAVPGTTPVTPEPDDGEAA